MEDHLLYSKIPRPPMQNTVFGMRKMLEMLEKRVEQLRQDSERVAAEKDSLVSAFNRIKEAELIGGPTNQEREELSWFADRIWRRANAVEVTVQILRDAHQEKALQQVNEAIDQLVLLVQSDAVAARKRCMAYITACTSQPTPSISTDTLFESAVLGCTLDDQKVTKKRLQGILAYFSKINVS